MTATPSVAAEQPGGVVDGRADAGLGRGHDAHDRLGRRRAGEAHPGAEQHHLARDRPVARAAPTPSRPRRRRRRQRRGPPSTTSLVPKRTASFVPTTEAIADRRRDRQQVHAGRQRAVALEELEVLGDQEDEPEQREERDRDRAARGGEARIAEQARRRASVRLVRRSQAMKAASSAAATHEAGQRRARCPSRGSGASMIVKISSAIAAVESSKPGAVEPGRVGIARGRHATRRPAARRAPRPGPSRRRCWPGEVLEQPAADDRPERDRRAGRRAPQADRPRALAALGEDVGDQRQRRREDHRGAEAHHARARRSAGPALVGQPADELASPKTAKPGQQHALAAEAVAEAARGEQQARRRRGCRRRRSTAARCWWRAARARASAARR